MGTRKPNSGTAVTELAIFLPVLMLIFVGTADFARVFYAAVKVADAARAGVQYGGQSNTFTGDFSGMHNAASQNATDVEGLTTTQSRFCKCQNGQTVNCLTDSCAEGSPQIYITVTAQKTFSPLVNYPGIPETVALSRQAIMRVQ